MLRWLLKTRYLEISFFTADLMSSPSWQIPKKNKNSEHTTFHLYQYTGTFKNAPQNIRRKTVFLCGENWYIVNFSLNTFLDMYTCINLYPLSAWSRASIFTLCMRCLISDRYFYLYPWSAWSWTGIFTFIHEVLGLRQVFLPLSMKCLISDRYFSWAGFGMTVGWPGTLSVLYKAGIPSSLYSQQFMHERNPYR